MTPRAFAALVVLEAAALAAALFVTDARRVPLAYAACIAAAAVPWLFICRALLRDGRRIPVAWVLAAGLALRVLSQLAAPAVLSDDIYRYAWEGRVQRLGHNPFLESPADLATLGAGDEVWDHLNNREIPAAYPPVGQLFLRLVAGFGGGVRVFRAAFALCDVLVMFLLAAWLARIGCSPALCCVHALCPLAVVEMCAEGHNDALGIALLVASLAVLGRGRGSLVRASAAGTLLGASIAAKFLPAVLLPWLARRDARILPACVLAFAASYVPFWPGVERFPELFAGLHEYGARWRSNDSLFAPIVAACEWLVENVSWLPPGAEAQRVAKIPLAILLGAGWLWILRHERSPAAAFVAALTLLFALTPTLHPWYVVWIVPFLAVRPAPAPFVLIVTVSLAYHVLPGWHHPPPGSERVWEESLAVKLVEYVPFYAVLIWGWTKRSRSPEPDA